MGTINTSMQAVQKAQIDLGEVDNLPPLGQDMVLYTASTHVLIYVEKNEENTFKIKKNVKKKKKDLSMAQFLALSSFKLAPDRLALLLFSSGIQGLDPEQDGRVQT